VKKRGLAYASLAILAALIGCTFVSRSVQTALKTSVDAAAPRRMELTVSKRLAGAMEYEKTTELRSEASYTVTKVLCRAGDSVREGTPIAAIDISEFERSRRLKELDLLRAENALAGAEASAAEYGRSAAAQRGELKMQLEIMREEYDEFVQSYPAGGLLRSERAEFERSRQLKELDLLRVENALASAEASAAEYGRSAAAQRAELKMQLEIARQEYDEFAQSYPADGLLRSDISGIVAAVYVEDYGATAPRQKIIELREDSASLQCVVWLPEEEARVFEPDDSAAVSYPKLIAANGKTELAQISAHAKISENEYDEEKRLNRIVLPLDSGTEMSNAELNVQLVHSYGYFDLVLPKIAVQQNEDGASGLVYAVRARDGLFGEENYVVAVEVGILAENMGYCAVESGALSVMDQVVVASSGALYDHKVVRVG
jgi:multidrug efflux pump subunit AcrA (membrane-fusion protein)